MAVPLRSGSKPGMPQAGAGTLPGQPPFGPPGLTQPTPNRGMQGAGAAIVENAIKMMEEAISKLTDAPEAKIALMEVIPKLRKHFPEGGVSPGMGKAAQEQFMMQQRQDNPVLNAIKMAGQQPTAQPPAGAQQPGGAPPPV